MRFNNPNEYGDAVLYAAGCTCKPKRVIQVLDASGAFVVEHYHTDDCATQTHAKEWYDTSTQQDRYLRRLQAQIERGEIEVAAERRRDLA